MQPKPAKKTKPSKGEGGGETPVPQEESDKIVLSQPLEIPPAAPATRETTVILLNKLSQMLPVEILNAAGVMEHVEIPAMGTVVWPKQPNYGPDIAAKITRGLLAFTKR